MSEALPSRLTGTDRRVTVVLANWKRPENALKILDVLHSQSLRPDIWVWNNGEELRHPAIQLQIRSSENLACWPRWLLGSMASTEYLCIVDDDLIFTDPDVLRDLASALEQKPARTIAGLFGMNLLPGKPYRDGEQVWPSPDTDLPADLIKGRCMMLRTDDLRSVHLQPRPERHVLIGDDIIVSGALSGGKPRMHVVPGGFTNRYAELTNDHSLFHKDDHFKQRERARAQAFPF